MNNNKMNNSDIMDIILNRILRLEMKVRELDPGWLIDDMIEYNNQIKKGKNNETV